MTTHTTFIPKKHGTLANENILKWKYGAIEKKAEFSDFLQGDFNGERYWSIGGGMGTVEEDNVFIFSMTLPYKGDDALKGIYTLAHGLTFLHSHSIPAPPGFHGFRTVEADSATLNIISYDRKTDIVVGTFDALFKSHGYRLNPKGTFTMKRLRPPAQKPSEQGESAL
ncbi:hypothetical protein B7L09_27420 [Pseudomonas mandelii]|uniref:hypothetical protein n=1 Tax=Pseudomonas TaxID=286 RepID=UPI000B976AC3|nr:MULTISPECIES: hypothetical protein [Pseudomonas]OYQ00933.1 hypothetical protein B7L09_27420 [Pseudomonas mandelii]